MSPRNVARWATALATTALLLLGVAGTASAHEGRKLVNGRYTAVVGFLNEPAFEGQLNGLSLSVVDETQKTAQGQDKPVEGLEKTLKAEVLFGGGKKLELTLRTRFGQPGKYAAYFEPTKAGQYTFHIYGQIEGNAIDERFESGPGRFKDVQSLAPLQFPEQRATVPADLQRRLDAADSAASLARSIGIAGLLTGLLGLATGILALRRRQVSPGSAAPTSSPATPLDLVCQGRARRNVDSAAPCRASVYRGVVPP